MCTDGKCGRVTLDDGSCFTGAEWAAVAASVAGAGASMYNAAETNSANAAINAHSGIQADRFFDDSWTRTQQTNQDARDFNSAEARAAWKNNSEEARRAREWSEMMAGTSYQRAVGDMQRAGLNPMLAYSQGGATTPSAAAASGGAASASPSAGPAGQVPSRIPMQAAQLQSAGQMADVLMKAKRQEAEVDLISSEAELNRTRIPQSVADTHRLTKQLDVMEQEITSMKWRDATEYAKAWLTKAQEDLTEVQTKLANGQMSMQEAQTAKIKLENQLLEFQRAEGQGRYKLNTSEYGQSGARAVLNEAASVAGTVSSGRNAFGGMK